MRTQLLFLEKAFILNMLALNKALFANVCLKSNILPQRHEDKTGRLGLCALVSLWHISSRTLSRIKNAICIEDNQPKKKSGISF